MSHNRQEYYEKSSPGSSLTYDEWVKDVFWFPVGEEMRLKFDGFKLLKKHFPCHIIDQVAREEKPIKSKHLIFLARFCRQPYYIYGSDHIAFFDEEEAFIFKLCDGDIDNVEQIAPERLPDE